MRWWLLLLAALSVSAAHAESAISYEQLYFGGGFGNTTISGAVEDRTTIQGLGGYRLTESVGVDPRRHMVAVEVGYQDTDKRRHDGRWAALVLGYRPIEELELLLRGGLEFGHDVGPIGGIGFGYGVNRKVQLRLEYVKRSEHGGVQFNFVLHPWRKKESLQCNELQPAEPMEQESGRDDPQTGYRRSLAEALGSFAGC